MKTRVSFLFANPHGHHSYFTVAALSRLGSVILLCPPLQLQLSTRRLQAEGLKIVTPTLHVLFCQLLSVLFFLLYKLRLLTERHYLDFLSGLSSSIIKSHSGLVWVHYQDYLQLSPCSRHFVRKDICELIIDSTPHQPNWSTTQLAVANADAVVVPTSSMSSTYLMISKPVVVAPYGGNKAAYTQFRHAIPYQSPSEPPKPKTPFTIVARSNSFRKGIDIFLMALDALSLNPIFCEYPAIEVCICGLVQEPDALELLTNFKRRLEATRSAIAISAIQYSQSDYSLLLAKADLFVMPSRLEGSSPAALEALWLGIPCVLSKECGVSQFKHGRHGILLESNDSVLLADAILLALHSSPLRADWRSSLAQDRQLFTWQNYFNAYRQLVDIL
jgi:glycosyltransferase involved in cell wall biosynthesis